jgi:prepilin-type N-terminal cleavage/methylation domain-containing protein
MNKADDNFADLSRRRGGFTLIELLAVVVMMVILMGLLLPAVLKAKDRSAVKRAELQVVTLKAAIQQYHYEFKKFPAPDTDLVDAEVDLTYDDGPNMNGEVVTILLAAGTISLVDYRFDSLTNIMTPRSVGEHYYEITLDLNYDGKVDGESGIVKVSY